MKNFRIIALTALILTAACTKEYNDSQLQDRLDKIKAEIEQIEKTLNGYKSQIETYNALISANSNGVYVTAVNEIKDGDKVIGYEICLEGREPIIIMNGSDGKPGQNGADGYSPKIGIVEKDGRFYWTVDGICLEDSPASPDPDMLEQWNGETPEVFIQDGKWYVRTSTGELELGLVSDSDCNFTDEVFGGVQIKGGILEITLENGTTLQLPLRQEFGVSVEATNSPFVWNYTVTGAFNNPSLNVLCPFGWSSDVIPGETSFVGEISLIPASSVNSGAYTFNILVSDGAHSTAATITINYNCALE